MSKGDEGELVDIEGEVYVYDRWSEEGGGEEKDEVGTVGMSDRAVGNKYFDDSHSNEFLNPFNAMPYSHQEAALNPASKCCRK